MKTPRATTLQMKEHHHQPAAALNQVEETHILVDGSDADLREKKMKHGFYQR